MKTWKSIWMTLSFAPHLVVGEAIHDSIYPPPTARLCGEGIFMSFTSDITLFAYYKFHFRQFSPAYA